MNLLAVSGSLRDQSSNTRLLRALALLAPPGVSLAFGPPLDGLPYFNPDVEEAGLPPAVQAWRDRVGACDAVVICSPEYAHGVSGMMKNALDWLVGGIELTGKPVAAVNARPEATLAHAALAETLRIMGANVIQAAVPLTGRNLDAEGIAADPQLAAALRRILSSLAEALR
ncbi:NADPH-dependent FMN reductase [Geothrix sp. 21YS21S-2]|uniref:NADPH-dependent FMN reductase n=1 Tax=Geothrix sp. 21YS21S-2 TaxID=3068893 RepID=UPI0027B9155B|nr:NADPH-dependent FMN reductase [Geothrix sp. 21YS21S-2]